MKFGPIVHDEGKLTRLFQSISERHTMKDITALPWRFTEGLNPSYISSDVGFVPIRTPFRSEAFDTDHAEAIANGKYIVQACNAFPQMREALEAAMPLLIAAEIIAPNKITWAEAVRVRALAKAALAAAKGAGQ